MGVLAYIELDCIGIIILLLIRFNQQNTGGKSFDQKLYNRGLLCLFLVFSTDIIMMLIENSGLFMMRTLNIFLSSLYFFLMPVVGYYWLCYADYRMYGFTHATKRRKLIYQLIIIIDFVVVVINLWKSWLFHIDQSNTYHKGLYVIFYLMLTFLYFLFASIMALHKAKSEKNQLERKEYYVLASFIILPLIGGMSQYLIGGLPLIWIGMVLSFLVVDLFVQNRFISTDGLTGLNNHHQLRRYLEWKTTSISEGEKLYAIVIDIDDFKAINEAHGRFEGNNALIQAANLIQDVCSTGNEFTARYAGDEFSIICERKDNKQVESLIQSIQRHLHSLNSLDRSEYQMSFSIGYSVFGKPGAETPKAFINAAYQDMYKNKKQKKTQGVND